MNSEPEPASPENDRRRFLKLSLAGGAAGLMLYAGYAQKAGQAPGHSAAAEPGKPAIDEHDAKNIKLAHRVPSSLADDEILFLKQIGLRWMRVEFRADESDLDRMSQVQKRFEKHGIKIFSAVHPAYR